MSTTHARRAFTIVELLIAVPLAALLFCAVAETLVLLSSAAARVSDEAAAYARADRAWSILREPLSHCGYGMPKDPAGYARAFLTGTSGEENMFYLWPGPLSITHSTVDRKRRERGSCRIVHAIPSMAATTGASVTSADRFTVELTDSASLLEPSVTNPIWPKNWAVFGAAQPPGPFWLAARDGAKRVVLRRNLLTSADAEIVTIPQNDELFYLRATEAEVAPYGQNDWALCTDRHDGSGRQPRIIGVVDARFELLPTGRTIKMRLLIRGDRHHSEQITPDTPPGWPDEYTLDIPDEARHYRLYAFEMTFGLSNF